MEASLAAWMRHFFWDQNFGLEIKSGTDHKMP